ncbi:helix-turn-helix transcriptional regulator [Knoellia subterranea]|uniref:DeoR family transcriptional regulator n=1 Tax=Knoellia subterranea KCTC 19937 TaxID=1385521 RepID=A0A0A0JK40_9MICO|nr:WYL domain-containing protein [Knoellia subterranea]KGN37114.1 DeoR family transcriptional regulator [Knoellia subterranea KCTC 19937]
MRADRLVSLVLMLRQHGRLSAAELARELEVSTRTVLRDMEALSSAGVPVYAERGRHGGFALLPGFRTELTGMGDDEVLALLVAGSRRGAQLLGLGPQLSAAMLKVVDALPARHRGAASDVAERLLIDPTTDLLARRESFDDAPTEAMREVRRAVISGLKLRIRYLPAAPVEARSDTPAMRSPTWRTVDPIGLVTVRDHGYLLATKSGEDRTYRLSRIEAAEALEERADRPDRVDLGQVWRERSEAFRNSGDLLTVDVRVNPARRIELASTAVAMHDERVEGDGWVRATATFQDERHAIWALWQLGVGAEVLDRPELRAAVRDRAAAVLAHYDEEAGAVPRERAKDG